MSTGLQIKVPSFLIESDRCVNEGYSGTEFGYVYGDNGYLLKHPTGTLKSGELHETKNVYLTTDIDYSKDFTLEICFDSRRTIQPLRFIGDNITVSSTTLYIGSNYVQLSYWKVFKRTTIRVFDPSYIDDDGFINALVVKKGNVLEVYLYGELQLSVEVNDIFASKDSRILATNTSFKRLAITGGLALPLALAYNSKTDTRSDVPVNLFLTDYEQRRISADKIEGRFVKNIISHGSWIYAIFNTGEITAISRPRGLDSGVTFANVSYDVNENKITIVTDDAQSTTYVIDVPSVVPPGQEIPTGTGVLTPGGNHKPIEFGDGVVLARAATGVNAMSFYDEPFVNKETLYLTDPNKTISAIDYSKRLSLKASITPGDENYPNFSPATGSPKKWIELPIEATTSDATIFSIVNGVAVLPKGNYYLRGFINIFFTGSEAYGFRITDGENDIFSRVYSTDPITGGSNTSSRIEFNETIYVPEETTVKLEEYFNIAGTRMTAVTGLGPVLISHVEFFKL
jgi:hypothetical protein